MTKKEKFDCPHCGNTYARFQTLGIHCVRAHGEKLPGVRVFRELYGRRVRRARGPPRVKRCKRKFPKFPKIKIDGASSQARFPTTALVYAVEAERWRLRKEEQERREKRRVEQEAVNMLLERLEDWRTDYEVWKQDYAALTDTFFVPVRLKSTGKKCTRLLNDTSEELRELEAMVRDYELGNLTHEDMTRLYIEEDFDGKMRRAFECAGHFRDFKTTVEGYFYMKETAEYHYM